MAQTIPAPAFLRSWSTALLYKPTWPNFELRRSCLPTLRPECNGPVNKSVNSKCPVPLRFGPHQGERHNPIVEMQMTGYSKSVPSNSQGISDYPRPKRDYRSDTKEDNSISWYPSEAGRPSSMKANHFTSLK